MSGVDDEVVHLANLLAICRHDVPSARVGIPIRDLEVSNVVERCNSRVLIGNAAVWVIIVRVSVCHLGFLVALSARMSACVLLSWSCEYSCAAAAAHGLDDGGVVPEAGGLRGTPPVDVDPVDVDPVDVEPGVRGSSGAVAGAVAGAAVVVVVSVAGVAGVVLRREKRNQMIAMRIRMPISHGQKFRPPLRSIGSSAMTHPRCLGRPQSASRAASADDLRSHVVARIVPARDNS